MFDQLEIIKEFSGMKSFLRVKSPKKVCLWSSLSVCLLCCSRWWAGFNSSSRATHRGSISSDCSPASCRSQDTVAAGVSVTEFGASDFYCGVIPRTPLRVDWLIEMRLAWTTIHSHLRSLGDYHTIFEYSRCHVPPRRGWVAWWNGVELRVADVDYSSDADGSTRDGLDEVSVLPLEAMYGNWLVLTYCDDMNVIRETVSPKMIKQSC